MDSTKPLHRPDTLIDALAQINATLRRIAFALEAANTNAAEAS